MANPNLQKIIKLTQSQYNTLANGGTVGDYTGLNDNYLYLIQEDYEFPTTTTARKILMSTSTAGLVSWESLTSNDIPNLAASKITSGTFSADRIPNLNASKITAGTFDIARIPTGTTASTVALGNHNHDGTYLGINDTAADSSKLNGQAASYYASRAWVDDNYLGKTVKASDSDLLDGHDSSYFATASALSGYLPLSGGNLSGYLNISYSSQPGNMPALSINYDNNNGEADLGDNGLNCIKFGTIDNYIGQVPVSHSALGVSVFGLHSGHGFEFLTSGWEWAATLTAAGVFNARAGLQINGTNVCLTNDSRLSDARPANGGNADTVDNEHASAFAHITRGNNLITAGNEFNFISDDYGGNDGADVWINYTTPSRNNSAKITGYILGNGHGGQLGVIIHSGNIGSQSVNYANSAGYASSAGNADTLDNHDSSYFYPASNPNGYTSVTESTVSGWGFTKNAGTVTQVKIGTTPYNPTSGVISLPAYPTSLPASDVYDWAKASTKPSYSFGEISAGNVIMGESSYLIYRSNEQYRAGFYYSTPAAEALVFAHKYKYASWIFANELDPVNRADWQSLSANTCMQIRDKCVAINKLWGSNDAPGYNLDVNGTLNANTIYENGSTLADKYLGKTAKAADSDLLDGYDSSYFINTSNIGSQSVYHSDVSDYATDAGYATNSASLGGNGPAYYLNYNNFTNTPSSVLYTSQTLTDAQKTQARSNIGAGTSNLAIGTTSTTAAAGNHTHTLSIASGGTSSINLAANTTYTLTAGGSTLVFKTPPAGTAYYANQYNSYYYLSSNSGATLFTNDIQAGVSIVGLQGGNSVGIIIGWPELEADTSKRSLLFNGNRVDLVLSDTYQNYIKGLSIDMYDDDYYTLHIRANDYSNLQGSIASEDGASVNLHAWSFEYTPPSVNSAVTHRQYVSFGAVMHNITYKYSSTVLLKMNIRGDSHTESAVNSYANLCLLLYNAGHRSAETCLTCSGRYSSYTYIVLGVYATSYNSGLYLVYCNHSSNDVHTLSIPSGTVSDTLAASLVP